MKISKLLFISFLLLGFGDTQAQSSLNSSGADFNSSNGSISLTVGQIINNPNSSMHQIFKGCTQDWADNFNSNATDDNGSCVRSGCTSNWADNYDNLATTNDGSCIRSGCMAQLASNYDLNATESANCIYSPCNGNNYSGSTTNEISTYGNASPEVIYQFEVESSGNYEFSTCGSDYDTYLRLYDSNMNQLAQNDDACGLQSNIEEVLSEGTYYVLVEGYANYSGSYELNVICNLSMNESSNENSNQTLTNLSCGTSYSGSTTNEISTYGNASPEVIYQFEVESSGSYEFSTCGSGYDTYLRLYDSNMNQLAHNDDACRFQSNIEEVLSEGTYYVLVEGYGNRSGPYILSLSCALSPANYTSSLFYNIRMHMNDSYGDGWNDNTYEITNSSNEVVANGGFLRNHGNPPGREKIDEFSLPEDCYTISVGGGTWQNEVSWSLTWSHASRGTSILNPSALGNYPIGHFDFSVGIDCDSDQRFDTYIQNEDNITNTSEMEISVNNEIIQNNLVIEVNGIDGVNALNFQLYDLQGKLITDGEIYSGRTAIKMDAFASGLYILRVTTLNKNIFKSFKVIKK